MSSGQEETPFPKFLFRYRSSGTDYFPEELRRVVEKGEQFFSSVEAANDPFDCNPVYFPSSNREIVDVHKKLNKKYLVDPNSESLAHLGARERKKKLKEKYSANFVNLRASRGIFDSIPENIRSESRIICLSEDWDNPLMWAHYANGHNGIVLKFAVDLEVAEFTSDDIPLDVIYSDERPVVSTTDLIAWFNSEKCDAELERRSNHAFLSYVLSKSRVWAYEKEWRVQKRFPGSDDYRFVPALNLVEVIVGARVDEAARSKIVEICREKVAVKQAAIDANKFSLVLQDAGLSEQP